MDIKLQLGGLCLRILLNRKVEIEPELYPFLCHGEQPEEVTVRISWDWEAARHPVSSPQGEDLIQTYYAEGDVSFCVTKAGPKGPIASTLYTKDFRRVVCTIHEKPFLEPPKRLGSILRFLPMRAIFQHFGVLFFHAAQVEAEGGGILFTAPSGGGKSTQANLWVRNRGGTLLCGDRTLLRRSQAGWRTYGYPIDGSSPVRTTESKRPHCLVLLSQAEENRVTPLYGARALAGLMPQLVIDSWSAQARNRAVDLLLDLIQDVPVYALACTPDARAVACLEQQLQTDGVLKYGNHS